MKRKSMLPPAVALISAAFSLPAFAGITFGPIKAQAGESIRLVTHSETPGGTIQKTVDGKSSSGTLAITRDRELIWTFRAPTPDGTRRGMVKVPQISTSTVVKIKGKVEQATDTSPLTGKMFAMSKTPAGDWKFELDGSVPLSRVQQEIEELTIYLKRNWYPAREVNVGDSWEFDPTWVKAVIEKDLSKAQTIGTMRLRQVRHTQKGKTAIIDLSIRSTGADFKADGSESSAAIELTGQVVINLQTMLDEELELKGKLVTTSNRPRESTKATLPIHLLVSKSFVRENPFP